MKFQKRIPAFIEFEFNSSSHKTHGHTTATRNNVIFWYAGCMAGLVAPIADSMNTIPI